MADLTEDQLTKAEALGRELLQTQPRAIAAHFDRSAGRVVVDLVNGCAYAFPTSISTSTASLRHFRDPSLDGERTRAAPRADEIAKQSGGRTRQRSQGSQGRAAAQNGGAARLQARSLGHFRRRVRRGVTGRSARRFRPTRRDRPVASARKVLLPRRSERLPRTPAVSARRLTTAVVEAFGSDLASPFPRQGEEHAVLEEFGPTRRASLSVRAGRRILSR